MKTDVVFFDIGHTLVTGAAQSPRRLLGARLNLSEKRTNRAGKLIMTHPASNPGQLADALSEVLLDFDPADIREIVTELWQDQIACVREIPGVTETLTQLKEHGFRLGLISNIWHPFFEGFAQNCAHLLPLIDFRILSYQHGIKKPAPEFYRQGPELADVPPGRCWMVGDSYELDMAPAAAVGYRTLWILCRPERERPLLVRLLRGEKDLPDCVVESISDVAPTILDHR